MYLVFPARRIASRAGIDSSSGVSMDYVSTGKQDLLSLPDVLRTWINAMEIVEVRSETESLNSSVNVLLDMRGRIGHCSIAEDIESTFGRN